MALFQLFRRLFPKKKLLYTAVGQDQYFRVAAKLASQGVRYYTKIQRDARQQNYFSERSRVYDIYVRVEDEGKAIKALQSK